MAAGEHFNASVARPVDAVSLDGPFDGMDHSLPSLE
jgi:hypothetical protein